jgi:putative transposase
LYNAFIEQRVIANQMRIRVSGFDQINELPVLKKELTEYAEIGSHVLQDVAKRVDNSFRRFYDRGFGFPKYQGRLYYNSFTYPDYRGWKLKNGRLTLTNCGDVHIKLHRPIEGNIKTVTIKRTKTGKWFVCFSCDNVPARVYPSTDKRIGIDLGLSSLVTTSDGIPLGETHYLKQELKSLRRTQRHMERQTKGGKRREKTRKQLAKKHEKIANKRLDMHHKVSTQLVRENAEIHHENISPQFMLHNHRLARAAQDAGWRQFLTLLQYKAATAGRKLVAKNPRNTSQECSGCGQLVPKKLSERWHKCDCGVSLSRDHNAAIVILNRPA